MNLQTGQIFADKYRIVKVIGQGGMGTVFEGENVSIRRRVAIKTLHAAVAEKRDVVLRFEREAQAAGRIGSAHIVEVLDLGDLPDGSRFMVMEFLEGSTLEQRIRSQGRLTPANAVPIVSQLLEGLEAAHQAGIVHRDLKPANVFLLATKGGQADFVKILDFGVSKFNLLNADEMNMTRTGSVVGTPFYMSPEQAKGTKGLDGRSDLYAVGVILYECITGQVPFHAETFNELIFKIVLESPPPPESFVPDLDPSFAAIIRRAMAREVSERFQSAAELRIALGDWAARFAQGLLPPMGGGTALLPPGAVGVFASPGPGGWTGGGISASGAVTQVPTAGVGAAMRAYGSELGPPPQSAHGYVAPAEAHGAQAGGPRKGVGGLIAGIAAVAVLGLGGGGFAAYRWSAGGEEKVEKTARGESEGGEDATTSDDDGVDVDEDEDEDDENEDGDENESEDEAKEDDDGKEGDEGAALASGAPSAPSAVAMASAPTGGLKPPPPALVKPPPPTSAVATPPPPPPPPATNPPRTISGEL